MGKNVRAHVNISGRVQGVFYRMETRDAAKRYGVTGWVRNKSDGTVEAVFEGSEENVHAVIEWCKQGPSTARVDNVDIRWGDSAGGFNDFKITY